MNQTHSNQVPQLYSERLIKIQNQMKRQDVGALLLTNPLNIRYATGISLMALWTAVNLTRYAYVPVEGEPVVFEYGEALNRTKKVWPKSRRAHPWQVRFAQQESHTLAKAFALEIIDLLASQGLKGSKVGVDNFDINGFLALKETGLHLTDSDTVLDTARKVKTDLEIEYISKSCAIAESALYHMESHIKPGVSENELLSLFWQKMMALGGEYCSTRLLNSGEKTNPWFQEAGDKIVRPGDLVAIDTDMKGPEGYLCDISRTFLCGDKPTLEQKEPYRVAYNFIQSTLETIKVGDSYQDFLNKAPAYPKAYQAQGYSCFIHGAGDDDEPPYIPYLHDANHVLQEGEFEENMVVCVEFYAGKVGAREGVKLEEQVVLTKKGPKRLSNYPFDMNFL